MADDPVSHPDSATESERSRSRGAMKGLKTFLRQKGFQMFPLRSSLQGYNRKTLGKDARAGLNVALLDFPQGMAYALIAGLPVHFGVYASALGSLLGPFFNSSRFVIIGSTNAVAVLTLSAFLSLRYEPEVMLLAVPLLMFLSGLFLITGAFLGVAAIIQYISRSVITGYITAAALLIVTNQTKGALGLSAAPGATLWQSLMETVRALPGLQLPSLFLALGTVVLYFLLRRLSQRLPAIATTLVVGSFLAWLMSLQGWEVATLDSVKMGQLPWQFPVLDFKMAGQLASGALAISFLCLLEASSIGRNLAGQAGDRLNMNQQMLSLGVSNLGGSFFTAMPISGSLTRSVLNFQSGAITPVSSLISGSILLIGILLFGPAIGWIAKPVLATLVILVGFSLLNWQHMRMVTHCTRGDAAVFYITLAAGVLTPLDTAIYIGSIASILLFFRKAARPELLEMAFSEEGLLTELDPRQARPDPEVSIVHVEGNLFFGAADLFQEQMRRVSEDPNLHVIILRLKNAHHLDASAIMALQELWQGMRENDRHLIVSGARPDVMDLFHRTGLDRKIGLLNIIPEDPQNPALSVRLALLRSKEVLGPAKPQISVYAQSAKSNPSPSL